MPLRYGGRVAQPPLYRPEPGDRARADARPVLRAGGACLPRRAAAARPAHRRCRREHRQPHAVLRERRCRRSASSRSSRCRAPPPRSAPWSRRTGSPMSISRCLGRAVGAASGTLRADPLGDRRARRHAFRARSGGRGSRRAARRARRRARSISSRSTWRGWRCRCSQVRQALSQRSIRSSTSKLWTKASRNSWLGSTGTAIASKSSFPTRPIAITFWSQGTENRGSWG